MSDQPTTIGHVPITLTLITTRTRPRWAARINLPRIGNPEGYGATPDEALHQLAHGISTPDIAMMREHATQAAKERA